MRNPVVLSEKPCSAVQRPSNSYPALCVTFTGKEDFCCYRNLMQEARRKVWIIVLRKNAKAVVNKCYVCQKLPKKPLDQLMG